MPKRRFCGAKMATRVQRDKRNGCRVLVVDDPGMRRAAERAGVGLVYKRGTESYETLAAEIQRRTDQQVLA